MQGRRASEGNIGCEMALEFVFAYGHFFLTLNRMTASNRIGMVDAIPTFSVPTSRNENWEAILSHRCLGAFSLLFLVVASCSRTEVPTHQVPPKQVLGQHADQGPSSNQPVNDHAHNKHHADHQSAHGASHSHSESGHAEHPTNHHQHASTHNSPGHAAGGHQLQPQANAIQANSTATTAASSSLEIFEKRILPIFQSTKPSSCAECHLSGVDLKEYIRPTQQETFGLLVSAGMIDVQKPDESKLLRFINRRPEKQSLVTDKVRQEEFEAFRSWIRAAAGDPKLLAQKDKAGPIGPQLPEEVIRHARTDRVLASFIDNIWNEVGRCAACHSPDRNQKQVKENGERVSWIKLRDPQATLSHMLEAGLIDPDNPDQSLLLLKPTMQVKHGGGQKMVVGDRTYKQFRRFIDDYATIVHGKYQKAEQLPKQNSEISIATDIWLKVEGVPAEFDKQLMQVDLYRRGDSGWSEYRVATSDRPVFGGGKLWQHSLSLTAPRTAAGAEAIRDERLPPGRYLVKLYVDRSGKLQKDFTAELNEQDFVGQVEVQSNWPTGYGPMTIVKFPSK